MQSQKGSHSDGFAVFPPCWPLVVPRGTPSLSQGGFAIFEDVLGLYRTLCLEEGGGGQVDTLLQAGCFPTSESRLGGGPVGAQEGPPGSPTTALVLPSCTTAATDGPTPLLPSSLGRSVPW